MLHKHASYREFLRTAGPEEKGYLVFAGTRNPLDCVVTDYFRRKAGERTGDNRLNSEKTIFIRENDASFADFVRRYHSHFHRAGNPLHRGVELLCRFENLQEDFSSILNRLGLEEIRPVPRTNRTKDRTEDFVTYYSREIQPMVTLALGRRMKAAGYSFPEGWRRTSPAVPFLLLRAAWRTLVFAVKLSMIRLRHRKAPGSGDTYSSRLRRTYSSSSREASNPEDGTGE